MFTKPGFVAKEYVAGRRKSYLDPIRMYLFTSAIFFLIFFSANFVGFNRGASIDKYMDNDERRELADYYQERLKENPADSMLKNRIALLLDTNNKKLNIDSLGVRQDILRSSRAIGTSHNTVEQYDSLQKALPEEKRDGWFVSMLNRKAIRSKQKYADTEGGWKTFFNDFLHKIPYLLFTSLPFFAALLKLLYIRRKNFYYSDHAVFTLYHYIFSFLLLLCLFGLNEANKKLGWSLIDILKVLFIILWPVYLFLEMKNFYGQSKKKTFVKFIVLNILGFFLIMTLFALFLVISFLQS
jgi:hypothetical protein